MIGLMIGVSVTALGAMGLVAMAMYVAATEQAPGDNECCVYCDPER
jgi:hypothetical protein